MYNIESIIKVGDYVETRENRVGKICDNYNDYFTVEYTSNYCKVAYKKELETLWNHFNKIGNIELNDKKDFIKNSTNKIEQLEYFHSSLNKIEFGWEKKVEPISNIEIICKINEIIDRLNEMSDSNED